MMRRVRVVSPIVTRMDEARAAPALGATSKVRVPLPTPEAPEVIVTHERRLAVAVQGRWETMRSCRPVAPMPGMQWAAGEILRTAISWVMEKVRVRGFSARVIEPVRAAPVLGAML